MSGRGVFIVDSLTTSSRRTDSELCISCPFFFFFRVNSAQVRKIGSMWTAGGSCGHRQRRGIAIFNDVTLKLGI